jgi:aerobic carbon-monoxide dehydrogenase large subunit
VSTREAGVSGPAAGRFVGQSVPRREDPRLLTGHGQYVDDVVVPGMLHAAFVRSDLARGRITRLDVEAARAVPGVRAVLTGADLNVGLGSMQPTMFQGDQPPSPCAPLRPLADRDVRFVGDPIALVVAESRYLAEDAGELVEVDLEPLPPVIDPERAVAETVELVHPELGSNVAQRTESPPDPALDAVFDGAAHLVTETIVQHRHTCVPMETRGVVAGYEPATGALDVWISTQNPHEVRQTCSRLLAVPEHRIRVRMGDVGGGFGQKYFAPRDELAVIAAAHRLGCTIKWIEDRRENLIASNHARADRMTVRMALDDDGHILGAHLDHLEDCGAYPVGGTGAMGVFVAMLFPGPYRIPKLGFRSTAVWTNTCGRGAYRGPWMMETVAREEMLDLAARRVGLDPLELRRRNCVGADELPFTTAMGMVLDHVTPAETLEQAVDLIGYDAFRAEQRRAIDDGRLVGIGIGLYVEPTSMASGSIGVETATVRVQPSGTVTVHLGTGSHGQSIETTMAQVVAEHLGVDYDDVQVVQGDTASAPFGGGTGGSRTAVVAGGATRDASLQVRDKAAQIAAHLLESAPEDLESAGGRISVRGTPTRGVSLAEVANVALNAPLQLPPELNPGLEATVSYQAPPITWSNACHVCTVEVDPATGKVTVLRYVVSEDCGVMINPMVVEGQIAGGVVQGLGGVLYEHLIYDEDGNPLTTTFLDYLLPTAAEVPAIEYGHVETRSPTPGGHKGMGEGGAIGAPPCVFNAVADALASRGAVLTDQPLTPSRILDALTG